MRHLFHDMTETTIRVTRCSVQHVLIILLTSLLTLAVNSAVIIPVAAYASGSVPLVNFSEEEEKRCHVTQSRIQQGVSYQKRVRDQEQITESGQAPVLLIEKQLTAWRQIFLPAPLLKRTVRGPPVL